MVLTRSPCGTYTCLISYPVNLIFSISFFILAFTAVVGNTLVLVTIYIHRNKKNFITSNRFLLSLAITCALIGYIVSPLSATQLLTKDLLTNLTIEEVRQYLHVWLLGTTFFLLSSVSYDRYTLLTRSQNYHQHMTRRKVRILLCISWIVPLLIPLLRYVNNTLFYVAVLVVMIGTFIILCIVYCFIVAVVRKKEKSFSDRQNNLQKIYTITNRKIKVGTSCYKEHYTDKGLKRRKYIDLAKIVSILLLCYLVCNAISVCYFTAIVMKYDFTSSYAKQILLLCSEVSSQLNSTLTSVVYFVFSSNFRKLFKSIFCLRKRSKNSASDIELHSFKDLSVMNSVNIYKTEQI